MLTKKIVTKIFIVAASLFLEVYLCSINNLNAQTLNKQSDLRASPSPEAKNLKTLPAGTNLKLSKREGFWVEVESGGAKGWLKLTDITMGTSAAGGISALDSGRTGKGNIVSTSAARGLTSKDLISAKPDAQEFEHLKTLAVSKPDAEQFAIASGLTIRSLSLLGAPSNTSFEGSKPNSKTSTKSKKNKIEEDEDD